jgi:hypothetical protein
VRASVYLFAHDLLDEGVETVLDRLQAAGVDGVVMAAAYHHSRDVFPHNPRRKVVFLQGGCTYFHPESDRYAGGPLQPRVADIAADVDPMALLSRAARARGMRLGAWVVALHNTRLAFEVPDAAPRTAFGDPLLNSLCPAHPAVRQFAAALVGDVARYAPDSIALEAVSYMGFDHGYHHERSFVPLSPNIRFLLGLCFCQHCLAAMRDANVDAERVQHYVRERVETLFASAANETHEPDVEQSVLRAACDGELGRFLDARLHVVTTLVREVVGAVRAESAATDVTYLDPSGATLGYATGHPATDASAASIAWRDGVDLAAVGRACGGVGMLAYFAEQARLRGEVEAYRQQLAPGTRLEVLLRPMAPDVDSAVALAARLETLRGLNIEDVAFYHYGFMRLESLDWIARAVRA